MLDRALPKSSLFCFGLSFAKPSLRKRAFQRYLRAFFGPLAWPNFSTMALGITDKKLLMYDTYLPYCCIPTMLTIAVRHG